MGLFGQGWDRIVGGQQPGNRGDTLDRARIRADWDTLRAQALTQSEKTEIDAIFSRYL